MDLVKFTEEILNKKLHSSVQCQLNSSLISYLKYCTNSSQKHKDLSRNIVTVFPEQENYEKDGSYNYGNFP